MIAGCLKGPRKAFMLSHRKDLVIQICLLCSFVAGRRLPKSLMTPGLGLTFESTVAKGLGIPHTIASLISWSDKSKNNSLSHTPNGLVLKEYSICYCKLGWAFGKKARLFPGLALLWNATNDVTMSPHWVFWNDKRYIFDREIWGHLGSSCGQGRDVKWWWPELTWLDWTKRNLSIFQLSSIPGAMIPRSFQTYTLKVSFSKNQLWPTQNYWWWTKSGILLSFGPRRNFLICFLDENSFPHYTLHTTGKILHWILMLP